MKKFLIIPLVFWSASLVEAQQVHIYYNSNWELVKPGNPYTYHRKCEVGYNGYFKGEVQDYLKNGTLIMKGSYANYSQQKEGKFAFYYNNGNLKCSGLYRFNKKVGVWTYFRPSGKKWGHVFYKDSWESENYATLIASFKKNGNPSKKIPKTIPNDLKKILDESQKFSATEAFEYEEGVTPEDYPDFSDAFHRKEEAEDVYDTLDLDIGDHETYYDESDYSEETLELYNSNNYYEETFELSDENDERVDVDVEMVESEDDESEVYTIVENPAQFPGGINAFYAHIQKELKYPPQAQENGVDGRVYVHFVIEADGQITEVKTLKGIGFGCDIEAERVVKQSPRWIPGQHKGKNVRQKMVLPITFNLSHSKNKEE